MFVSLLTLSDAWSNEICMIFTKVSIFYSATILEVKNKKILASLANTENNNNNNDNNKNN